MKKLLVFPLILLLASCAGLSDLTRTKAAPTYGEKESGDTWSNAEHNELYNSVVTAVSDIAANEEDIATNTEDIATNSAAIATKMANPMTTAEDVIKGGESGAPTRVAAGQNALAGWNEDGTYNAYTELSLDDSDHQFYDDEDSTRKAQFLLDGITANNTRSYTLPDRDGTMALNGIATDDITEDKQLTSSECFGHHYYVTAACDITLPVVAEYMYCYFTTIGAYEVEIGPQSPDLIILDGTALDDGDFITNGSTTGDWAELRYRDGTGWYAKTNSWTDGGAAATECAELYAPSLTADADAYIGNLSDAAYYGLLFTADENADVCAIDAYVRGVKISGTAYYTAVAQGTNRLTSAYDYYARIYSVNQTTDVTTGVIATSNVVAGEEMIAATWLSENAGMFEFASPQTLTADTKYAIVFFVDRDGTLTDAPEIDSANSPYFGFDNENAGDSSGDHQPGRIYYSHTDIGSAVGNLDEEDDLLVKIHTVQAVE